MSTGEYEKRKQQEYRQQLEDAYLAYERREPGSMDKLLVKVQKFAYRKLYSVELDNPKLGTIGTVDDYAQDVMIAVWEGLTSKSFRGDVSTFYAYVNKIWHNKKQDFLAEIVDQRNNKVGLTVPVYDEYGSQEDVEDNPEIYESDEGCGFDIRIPSSVQGIDLMICKMLLTEVRGEDDIYRGRNYKQVGELLGMTENAVKKRLKKLRNRLKSEKEAAKVEQQKIWDDAEAERRNSFSIGLAKIRGAKS